MGSGSPIYDGLVEERGDVLTQVRLTAEQTRRTALEVLGRPGQRMPWPPREQRRGQQ